MATLWPLAYVSFINIFLSLRIEGIIPPKRKGKDTSPFEKTIPLPLWKRRDTNLLKIRKIGENRFSLIYYPFSYPFRGIGDNTLLKIRDKR